MTPCEKLGYKVGDRFELTDNWYSLRAGAKLELEEDDGTDKPYFRDDNGIAWAPRLSIVRPLKPEWDGTGLPPVGAVVEILNDRGYEIIYGEDVIGESVIVNCLTKNGDIDIVVVEFMGILYCFRADMCRPLRTERDKAIEDILKICGRDCDNKIAIEQAGKIYDAGYRKPQHKEG